MLESRGRDPVSRGRAEHEVPCARLPVLTLQEQFADLTVQRQPDRGRHRLVGDASNDFVAELSASGAGTIAPSWTASSTATSSPPAGRPTTLATSATVNDRPNTAPTSTR